MHGPDKQFWQDRFDQRQTIWDRGGPNPQLLAWLDSGELQPCRILVPGCGAGWEVAELARRGFAVTGLDYLETALERTRHNLALQGAEAELIQADVLEFETREPFQAIYEQTCLCALYPDHWLRYSARLPGWLRSGGRLCALFMQAPRPAALETGHIEGPPFHCDINAMRALFPEARWIWPSPPFARVAHPNGWHELAVPLTLRDSA